MDVSICVSLYLLHSEYQHTHSSSRVRAFLAEGKGAVLRLDLGLGQV